MAVKLMCQMMVNATGQIMELLAIFVLGPANLIVRIAFDEFELCIRSDRLYPWIKTIK